MIRQWVWLLLLAMPLPALCAVPDAYLTVTVHDEIGKPLEGVTVQGYFTNMRYDYVPGPERIGVTNDKGVVKISGPALVSVNVEADKEGYYKTEQQVVVNQERTRSVSILLRPERNPVAMYAKRVSWEIQDRAKEYGVDLIKGDFVAPFGKGSHPDIVMHIDRELKGGDNYSQTLSVDFPNPSDGFVVMDVKDEWRSSEYKTDYVAPVTGYKAGLKVVTSRTASGYDNENTNTPLYLRIRSAADEKGNVGSAQYCKIWPSIEVLGALIDRPLVKMTYYCNPTPNDRNVEFDLENNLLRNLKDEERPRAP